VLETEVLLPPLPQHAGAYGAALLALSDHAAACENDGSARTVTEATGGVGAREGPGAGV